MDGDKAKSNEIRESARRDMRPSFLGGNEKSDKVRGVTDDVKNGDRRQAGETKSVAAANDLRKFENASERSLAKPQDGLAGTRNEENQPRTSGFYSGKGEGKGKSKSKGKSKGRFKKGGPFAAIILSIFGFGGVMMGTQMFQPFSLVAQFQEKFNSMSVSTTLRTSRFVKWQMSDITDGNVKDPIKFNVFGKAKFKISNKQKSRLAAQGIDYDESANVMKFYTGEVEVDADGNTVKKYIEVNAKNFDDVYVNNAEFHQAYNAGSKTWRGQFANWFGSVVISFVTNNKLTRNMFADFNSKVEEGKASGKSSMDVFKETINEKIAGGETSGSVKRAQQEENETTDSEGKPIKEEAFDSEGRPIIGDSASTDDISTKTMTSESAVKTKLNSIAGGFQKGTNMLCIGLQFFGTVSLLATAAEVLQIINITTAAFETVDKVKAGYGDESPIHDLTNALNEKAVNNNYVLTGTNNTTVTGSDLSDGKIGDLAYEEKTGASKSAMESAGIAALYGNGQVNASDPSVASFNLSQSLNGIFGGLMASGASFAGCAVLKASAALVSAAVDTAEIIGCLAGVFGAAFTFGASAAACGPYIGNLAKKLVISAGIAAFIGGIIALITPVVTKMFTRNLVDNLAGEDFGNALVSGANIYQGSAHRSAGGSLATEEKYAAYLVEQQTVIADQAQYERESLSPFDITSKYTFMGTLLTQLMSFTTSSNTLMSAITAGGTAVSNSLIAMSPTASAYNIADVLPDMDEYADTCPYLAAIGAVGDAFCNPYIMTDTSTMDKLPEDVIAVVQNNLEDTLTNDGNVKVKSGSDLAEYIMYCGNRTSSFGLADNNIANAIGSSFQVDTNSSTFNNLANGGIGGIPVIGDLIDIVNSKEQLDGLGYITGESCVAGNTVDGTAPNWDKAKYYQRFIEDQALAESMGLIEESAVTAYLREYYEENPLDNSYEGILARYSGLDKETVAFTLDLIWYADYIANYDPSERYAFGEPAVKLEEQPIEFDNENVLAAEMNNDHKVVYADVRNRYFVI